MFNLDEIFEITPESKREIKRIEEEDLLPFEVDKNWAPFHEDFKRVKSKDFANYLERKREKQNG